jgi:hypothetical protein
LRSRLTYRLAFPFLPVPVLGMRPEPQAGILR